MKTFQRFIKNILVIYKIGQITVLPCLRDHRVNFIEYVITYHIQTNIWTYTHSYWYLWINNYDTLNVDFMMFRLELIIVPVRTTSIYANQKHYHKICHIRTQFANNEKPHQNKVETQKAFQSINCSIIYIPILLLLGTKSHGSKFWHFSTIKSFYLAI